MITSVPKNQRTKRRNGYVIHAHMPSQTHCCLDLITRWRAVEAVATVVVSPGSGERSDQSSEKNTTSDMKSASSNTQNDLIVCPASSDDSV